MAESPNPDTTYTDDSSINSINGNIDEFINNNELINEPWNTLKSKLISYKESFTGISKLSNEYKDSFNNIIKELTDALNDYNNPDYPIPSSINFGTLPDQIAKEILAEETLRENLQNELAMAESEIRIANAVEEEEKAQAPTHRAISDIQNDITKCEEKINKLKAYQTKILQLQNLYDRTKKEIESISETMTALKNKIDTIEPDKSIIV